MESHLPGLLKALALAAMLGGGTASAAELRIGTLATPTLDPHFLYLDSNVAYQRHIYGSLLQIDENGRLVPDLATSWEADGETIWRFRLRQGVTFHDGSPFTAEDVVFSMRRVPSLPSNPAPYTTQLQGVTEVRKLDDHTVEFVTAGFNPILQAQIAQLAIVSRAATEGRSTEDFNSGRAAIGTGPYRFVEFTGRDRLVVEPFAAYQGPKPEWSRVTFRVIPSDTARNAALLAGDVDLIEAVPPRDAARLAATPGISVHAGGSTRVMFLGVNLTPGSGQTAGANDPRNPLMDPRVREAISVAMNRQAMVGSLLSGYGATADQIAVAGMTGHVPDAPQDRYSVERARQLLREAGYPDGFSTALVCTNNRYVADEETCQAAGQMLARIGIRAAVEAIPANVYFGRVRAGRNPAPLFLGAWGNSRGDMGYTLGAIFHSYSPQGGLGSSNRSGWADPETDREIQAALTEHDKAGRAALLTSAHRRAIEGRSLIPLFTAPVLLASSNRVAYRPGSSGSSELTLAMKAHPKAD
jgi:peptide/nickel transport system substrate-binding protein